MTAVAAGARVTTDDRLGLTLFLAAVVHALVILGIGFDFEPREPAVPPQLTMDITLVHHRSEEPPEQADYLAQASQDGGGNTDEQVRPEGPVSVPNVEPTPGDAPANDWHEGYAPESIQAFRREMQTKLGSVEVANQRWGTAYVTWDQVAPPPESSSARYRLDWRRFKTDGIEGVLDLHLDQGEPHHVQGVDLGPERCDGGVDVVP